MEGKTRTLGSILKEARKLVPFTLRQVEEATGISNAYLSQLENDIIKKPSANILYKLSSLYRLDFDSLMSAAGMINEQSSNLNKPMHQMINNSKLLSSQNLTNEEEEELLNYLQYIRSKKK